MQYAYICPCVLIPSSPRSPCQGSLVMHAHDLRTVYRQHQPLQVHPVPRVLHVQPSAPVVLRGLLHRTADRPSQGREAAAHHPQRQLGVPRQLSRQGGVHPTSAGVGLGPQKCHKYRSLHFMHSLLSLLLPITPCIIPWSSPFHG